MPTPDDRRRSSRATCCRSCACPPNRSRPSRSCSTWCASCAWTSRRSQIGYPSSVLGCQSDSREPTTDHCLPYLHQWTAYAGHEGTAMLRHLLLLLLSVSAFASERTVCDSE